MGMIDKGVPEICLFQSNDIKTFLSNSGMHCQACRSTKATVYEGCLISSRPKVEADVLYSCKLVRVQIKSVNENTASLKLLLFLVFSVTDN